MRFRMAFLLSLWRARSAITGYKYATREPVDFIIVSEGRSWWSAISLHMPLPPGTPMGMSACMKRNDAGYRETTYCGHHLEYLGL